MSDRILELEQEVERLRDLLFDHDIDPDPTPELYGPPTAPTRWDFIVAATLRARSISLVDSVTRTNPLLRRLTDAQ